MNDYKKIKSESEFSHQYACWAINHNGWSKAKKLNRKLAKKKLKRDTDKEIENELLDLE